MYFFHSLAEPLPYKISNGQILISSNVIYCICSRIMTWAIVTLLCENVVILLDGDSAPSHPSSPSPPSTLISSHTLVILQMKGFGERASSPHWTLEWKRRQLLRWERRERTPWWERERERERHTVHKMRKNKIYMGREKTETKRGKSMKEAETWDRHGNKGKTDSERETLKTQCTKLMEKRREMKRKIYLLYVFEKTERNEREGTTVNAPCYKISAFSSTCFYVHFKFEWNLSGNTTNLEKLWKKKLLLDQ